MTKAAELAKMGEVLTNSQIGGRRNLIINGAMQVNQRGSVTFDHAATATANVYGCDRFQFQSSNLDNLEGTVTQVADAPVGFTSSLKWTTTEPESAVGAAETFDLCQKIEGQDLQQLSFGTSSAKKLSLRFYVKSSVTGTYGINVYKADSTARQLTSTYTISSADTWEEKTFVFPADTDSGATIANDNGEGLRISWLLLMGSNFTSSDTALTWTDYADAGFAFGHAQNGVATTDNATWQLTGVQLEVGDYPNPTPFEHRSFGEELALCQRYYYKLIIDSGADSFATGSNNATTTSEHSIIFAQTMRANPTAIETTGTAGDYQIASAGSTTTCNAVPVFVRASLHTAYFRSSVSSGLTAGNASLLRSISSDAYLAWEAEL